MLEECELNGKIDLEDELEPGPGRSETGESKLKDQESQVEENDELLEEIIAQKTQAEKEVLKLRQEVERLNKTNSSMVMKYANSEKEVLRRQKELENSDKQIKGLMKEIDTLNKKNKMLSSERERLIHMVDSKVCEMLNVQKECERLKEDIISKDFKIKWTQNKLNSETDEHKETKLLLNTCQEQLTEARDEVSKMRKDCQDMIAACSPSPEPEIPELTLSMADPDTLSENEKDLQLNPFQKEIETLKSKHKALIEENNALSCKVQNIQQERLDMEQKISRLQESNGDHLHQIASLQSDLAAAESIRLQLNSEQERVTAMQAECDQLRRCNSDLLADMGLCRKKEAELLAYTQQVTEKNVVLQSEFSSVESKSVVLEVENENLNQTIKNLQEEIKTFEKALCLEKKGFTSEKQEILDKMESQKNETGTLQRQLDEARGEIIMLKKKHAASLRELSRELHLAMKVAKENTASSDGISQNSRTSSSNSLNNIETAAQKQRSAEVNGERDTIPEYDHPIIPDQQALVERIVKLQRNLAKKQEKIEFLQEHEKYLITELQKKTKIIQSYAMALEPGVLATDSSDQNKHDLGKQIMAEVVKHGGIMASVYGSKQADNSLTLELSLEITKKLQAVLEDTLLKNITLKTNINTLGEEIEKLTESNRNLSEMMKHSQ